jgi:hypothetical protein
VGEAYAERVENLIDDLYFRQIVEWSNVQAETIALFLTRGDMQEDFFFHFFTVPWSQGTEEFL